MWKVFEIYFLQRIRDGYFIAHHRWVIRSVITKKLLFSRLEIFKWLVLYRFIGIPANQELRAGTTYTYNIHQRTAGQINM